MSGGLRPRYAEVWLHGQQVGWLCEANSVVRFVCTEGFLFNQQRQTLSFSLSVPGAESLTQRILSNRFNPAIYRERGELPPFFAGLLAEGSQRRRLAATRKNPHDMDDLGVLVAAGEDLPGAVVIRPADLKALTPAARAAGTTAGDKLAEAEVPEAAIDGAASLAGMQDKLALIALPEGRGYRGPIKGQLSDVIAKLPREGDDSQIMNEYACMQLAALVGVDVASCQLVLMRKLLGHSELVEMVGGEKCFLAVDRFDRNPNGAIHVEDACQLLTLMPNQKYACDEQFVILLALLNRLSPLGIEDVRQLIIRRVVNTLLGNSDAHLKNIGVRYLDGIWPQLAPAYDLVCVSALPGYTGFSTNVAIDKMQRAETLEDYVTLARRAGVSDRIARTAVRQTIARVKELWPRALKTENIAASVKNEVGMRLSTLPIASCV